MLCSYSSQEVGVFCLLMLGLHFLTFLMYCYVDLKHVRVSLSLVSEPISEFLLGISCENYVRALAIRAYIYFFSSFFESFWSNLGEVYYPYDLILHLFCMLCLSLKNMKELQIVHSLKLTFSRHYCRLSLVFRVYCIRHPCLL